jgi:hypothetical protein
MHTWALPTAEAEGQREVAHATAEALLIFVAGEKPFGAERIWLRKQFWVP